MQFGSVMVDEQSVIEELLAPNEQYFAQLLAELAGRAQFNLRVGFHEPVVLAEVVAADPEIRRLHEHTATFPRTRRTPTGCGWASSSPGPWRTSASSRWRRCSTASCP